MESFSGFRTEVLHTDGEVSPGLGSLSIRSEDIYLHQTTPPKNNQKNLMHKDTGVFLCWLTYDSSLDSLPIFTYFQKIDDFPLVHFSLFPTSPACAFTFAFSACFFCCSPFCFLFLFITFQRPPSPCPYSYPALMENTSSSKLFFWSEWQETLLIQCSKDLWYNESSRWFYSLCQNMGWP